MRKIILILSVISAVLSCQTALAKTLNVYNWGEYISDGSEESVDVNAEFVKYYLEEFGEEIKVNYTTYASNEDMYNKIKSGAASYDVIIPSDYMIEKMINENMLVKLNFDNIPNYRYVNENYKNLFFDPQNEYSVPYTYGMVGIIYNKTMVDEEDIGGWDLLWNEKYRGQILQFNNPRDAFGTAIYSEGGDVNSTDEKMWHRAAEKLKFQKPLIQSYVMDEIFNKMKNGSAAIAPYYAGDYLTMYDDNEDLAFYYPKEGTNVFVDSMCIPACAREKEIAERYINFMLSTDIAVANAEYVAYSSPHDNVVTNEDYIADMTDWNENVMEILYPDSLGIKTTFYQSLDEETLKLQNSLWESLKLENSVESWVYVTTIVILLVLLGLWLRGYIVKQMRDRY